MRGGPSSRMFNANILKLTTFITAEPVSQSIFHSFLSFECSILMNSYPKKKISQVQIRFCHLDWLTFQRVKFETVNFWGFSLVSPIIQNFMIDYFNWSILHMKIKMIDNYEKLLLLQLIDDRLNQRILRHFLMKFSRIDNQTKYLKFSFFF